MCHYARRALAKSACGSPCQQSKTLTIFHPNPCPVRLIVSVPPADVDMPRVNSLFYHLHYNTDLKVFLKVPDCPLLLWTNYPAYPTVSEADL